MLSPLQCHRTLPPSYRHVARQLLATASSGGPSHMAFESSCQCPDGHVFAEDDLHNLVCKVVAWVHSGTCVYVHCRGGHGRTGIVVACVLAVLYHIPPGETLHRINA